MSASPADTHDDAVLVERALAGDEPAIRTLRSRHHGHLKARLLRRGASETDAEEILTDLWGDCVVGKFRRWQPQAGSSLVGWLSSVATNRLIDHFRKGKFHADGSGRDGHDGDHEPSTRAREVDGVSHDPPPRDAELTRLLRGALACALERCDQTGLLMLKLVHLHGLTGREVARMWGWHESKVSRTASHTEDQIRELTLAEVRRREPSLDLVWEDLVELCANCRGSLFGTP